MKCPSCQASFSDLRDLCPTCATDLRLHKKALGLPITWPNLSYEALKKKSGLATTPQRVKASDLLGKPKAPPPSPELPGEIIRAEAPPGASVPRVDNGHPVESPPIPPPLTPTPAAPVSTGMDPFFEAAAKDIQSAETSIEIGLEDVYRSPNQERVELHFTIAAEALENPEAENIYQTKTVKSAERKVETQELTQRLEQVKQATQAPGVSLKGSGAKPAPEPVELEPLPSAPLQQRMVAFIIDAGIAAGGACLLSIAPAAYLIPDFKALLAQQRQPDSLDVLAVVATWPFWFLVIFVLLQACGQTVGRKLAEVQVFSQWDREPASRKARWTRALLTPINLIAFGWMPVLWNRPPLSEQISRTITASEKVLLAKT